MNQEHIDFLEANKINFETVKLGFTRNISHDTLRMYEHIYHLYINPSYVLTYWCGDCVFDMLKRLMHYYENLPKVEPAAEPVTEPAAVVTPSDVKQTTKRIRKK
jgi:hypothetical protein